MNDFLVIKSSNWVSVPKLHKPPIAAAYMTPAFSLKHLILALWDAMVAQMVKNPPAMQEIQVHSLGWEDPLEKGMATHTSILAWRIPWTEESERVQSLGSQRVRHDWATKTVSLWDAVFSKISFPSIAIPSLSPLLDSSYLLSLKVGVFKNNFSETCSFYTPFLSDHI